MSREDNETEFAAPIRAEAVVGTSPPARRTSICTSAETLTESRLFAVRPSKIAG
uniref:Uncharacterized protein n=1 Tax=uncultured marine virus TaxID=186617 RepID=A0A0F7LB16_9VIRU|nr:hypothetical protein [uncultured marine virus]